MEAKDANSIYAGKADDFLRAGDKKIKGCLMIFCFIVSKK